MDTPPKAILAPTSTTSPQAVDGFIAATAGLEHSRARLVDACQGMVLESVPRPALVRNLWGLAAPRP
eukprot:5026969-Prymnesium_polylepis.1